MQTISARSEKVGLCLLFVALTLLFKSFSSLAVGGADSAGYFEAATRLSEWQVFKEENVFSRFGLPEDASLTHTLGLEPHRQSGTLPHYPLGYSALMVPFIWLFGAAGIFWIVPLMSAAVVVLTYVLARNLISPPAGLVAGLLMLSYPAFLFMGAQHMSDNPATLISVLSFVLLLCTPGGWLIDLLLGSVLGLGVWIRPNMVLIIPPIFAWLLYQRQYRRMFWVMAGGSWLALLMAYYNSLWFGSAAQSAQSASGLGVQYRPFVEPFFQHLLNINNQQLFIGGIGLIAGIAFNRVSLEVRLLFVTTTLIFLVFFSFYSSGQGVWSYRFLLPVMPLVVVVQTGFFMALYKPSLSRQPKQLACTTMFCAGLLGNTLFSLYLAERYNVFSIRELESRYVVMAQKAQKHVKQPAVILSYQHGLSMRIYTDFPTLRLFTPVDTLVPVLEKLARKGAQIYLAMENWERKRLLKRWKKSGEAGQRLTDKLHKVDEHQKLRLFLYRLEGL